MSQADHLGRELEQLAAIVGANDIDGVLPGLEASTITATLPKASPCGSCGPVFHFSSRGVPLNMSDLPLYSTAPLFEGTYCVAIDCSVRLTLRRQFAGARAGQ